MKCLRSNIAASTIRAAALTLVLGAGLPLGVNAQTLLFGSGYEPPTALAAPGECYGNGCWQRFNPGWNFWGGPGGFQLHADAPVTAETIGDHMFNEILTVTGHNGSQTEALYSQVTRSGCCGAGRKTDEDVTQNAHLLLPASEASNQLYISYWIKLQEDLPQLMQVGPLGTGEWNWRELFTWKTDGDYRVAVNINRDPFGWTDANGNHANGNLYWIISGDNVANGGLPYKQFWTVLNMSVPVPVGQWFKFEVFWRRSLGADGRVWMAVNGQVIVDRFGRNMASSNPLDPEFGFVDSPRPINRIVLSNLYTSTSYPIYHWMDDLEIWSDFPADATQPH
jgi:hypothetical protein